MGSRDRRGAQQDRVRRDPVPRRSTVRGTRLGGLVWLPFTAYAGALIAARLCIGGLPDRLGGTRVCDCGDWCRRWRVDRLRQGPGRPHHPGDVQLSVGPAICRDRVVFVAIDRALPDCDRRGARRNTVLISSGPISFKKNSELHLTDRLGGRRSSSNEAFHRQSHSRSPDRATLRQASRLGAMRVDPRRCLPRDVPFPRLSARTAWHPQRRHARRRRPRPETSCPAR